MRHYGGMKLAVLALVSALAVTGAAGPALAAPTEEMGEEPLAAQTPQTPELTTEVAVPMTEENAPAATPEPSLTEVLSTQATTLKAAGAKINVQEVVYNRENPLYPKFTVTVGDKVLVEGKDYKTLYVGTYPSMWIHVRGLGDYGASMDSISEWIKTLVPMKYIEFDPIPEQAYTGKPITPQPTAWFGTGKRVSFNLDAPSGWMNVKTTYHNNVNPGFGRITLSGYNAYQTGYGSSVPFHARFTGTRDIVFAIRGEAKTFSDVAASHWAKGVIGEATALGLFSGYPNGKFGPNDKVTRSQVATVLWLLSGKPGAGTGAKQFSDVKAGAYYAGAVAWASSVGVVSGYPNGRFGPNDAITREQFAVMVANYASKVAGRQVVGSAADFSQMKDAAKVSGWARSSVGFCFKNNILSGSSGKINPQGEATRAESAKMTICLYNMLKK